MEKKKKKKSFLAKSAWASPFKRIWSARSKSFAIEPAVDFVSIL